MFLQAPGEILANRHSCPHLETPCLQSHAGKESKALSYLCRLPERQSKCELEVDACVEDILNRQEVSLQPYRSQGQFHAATEVSHVSASSRGLHSHVAVHVGSSLN